GLRRPPRALVVALCLHFVIQLGMPLRRLAYPGETAWSEEGFRFAWQVMLVEKTGTLSFRVRDPATGRQRIIDAESILSPLQAKQVPFQADMVLELAHMIAAEERRKGREVEVRADAYVAYNGRGHARLIDPDVDLAKVEDGLAPKAWILPAPSRR
ncbi:MAG: HTTM domain-containing protein, partial [Myxococcales bacterium]|nr:HTTM domain-containing protein [Myxococcales bacterium]